MITKQIGKRKWNSLCIQEEAGELSQQMSWGGGGTPKSAVVILLSQIQWIQLCIPVVFHCAETLTALALGSFH